MLKIFYGTNTFNKRLELAKLKADFSSKNGPYSIRELVAEDIDAQILAQDLMANGLFASKELIIIRSAEDDLDILRTCLDAPESDLKDVILLITTLDKRTAEYKSLLKHPGFTEFTNLPEQKLKTWISQTSSKLGLSLSSSAIQDLILRTNSDQQEIWICLNQLVLLDKSEIEGSDLDTFLPASSSETAFNLLESALKKDRAKVKKTLTELELFREDPYQIIGLLCSQGFFLAAVTFGRLKSISSQTITGDTGIHPFAASQQLKLSQSLNLNKAKISKITKSLGWLDISLKTVNKTEPWPMLDAALMQISML